MALLTSVKVPTIPVTETNLADIKQVVHLHDEYQVNYFLQDGWVILSVGPALNGEEGVILYVMGNVLKETPAEEFDKFLCEYCS
ncbi:MAG: hypothetical protein ACE3JP_11805 [Ectobacillus sp.]